MSDFVVRFLDLLITVLYIAVFARVIVSWLPVGSANNPVVAIIYQITEPILAPLRRVIPRVGLFDLTPMVAIILLGIIQVLIHRL